MPLKKIPVNYWIGGNKFFKHLTDLFIIGTEGHAGVTNTWNTIQVQTTCLSKSFKKIISHQIFDYKITFELTTQHKFKKSFCTQKSVL